MSICSNDSEGFGIGVKTSSLRAVEGRLVSLSIRLATRSSSALLDSLRKEWTRVSVVLLVLAVHGRLGWFAVRRVRGGATLEFFIAEEGRNAPKLVNPVIDTRLVLGSRVSFDSVAVCKVWTVCTV